MQANTLSPNPLLSSIAVDVKNRDYIADQVLTPVGVPNMLCRYIDYDQGVTFKAPVATMAQNGTPNTIELKGTIRSLTLDTRALKATVDPLEQSQSPQAQIEAMKTVKLQNALLLDREIRVASAVLSAGQYGGNTDDLSGNDQWSDYVHSNPILAIAEAQNMLPRQANRLFLGRDVYSALRIHPVIIAALSVNQLHGMATLEQLAGLFEVEKVVVGAAYVDTAGEGLAADPELIWQESAGGGVALLAYVDPSPPSPLMDQPTLGYLPTLGGAGVPVTRIYKYVNQLAGTGGGQTEIKAETAYKALVSAPQMGFLWTSVLS